MRTVSDRVSHDIVKLSNRYIEEQGGSTSTLLPLQLLVGQLLALHALLQTLGDNKPLVILGLEDSIEAVLNVVIQYLPETDERVR